MSINRDLANIISGGFTSADIPNLDASKITSGTFADARIAASNVSQHAQSFDDDKIINDISTLAIRQASDENKSAYNTNSSSVDVFQDATGIDTLTNANRNASEYVNTKTADETFGTLANMTTSNWNFGSLSATSGSGTPITITHGTSPDEDGLATTYNASTAVTVSSGTPFQIQWNNSNSTGRGCFITVANTSGLSGNPHNSGFWNLGNTHMHTTNSYGFAFGTEYGYVLRGTGSGSTQEAAGGTITMNNSDTVLLQGDGAGYIRVYIGGTLKYTTSNAQDFTKSFQFGGTGGNACTGSNLKFSTGTAEVFSATGNFTGTNITAPSSVSSMGAIITYQNNFGTNALNTDIVLQLSADGGSNYSTATLTALPDFSTGIKMAKVNDLAVTAGTTLKYKISFANQSSGSKEARIRGVALQY